MRDLVAILVILLAAAAALALLRWLFRRKTVLVMPGQVGFVFRGKGEPAELGPGLHRLFDPTGAVRAVVVPTAPLAMPAQTLEVISKDRFSFRVSIAAMVTIVDPLVWMAATWHPDPAQNIGFVRFDRLEPTLADAVTRIVAALTLDEFLADPKLALAPAESQATAVLVGARLDALRLTSVTLPPELRKMFTEIERARHEGLAALERARAEQASLRALANAARAMADNPQLAQLRMLQVMENAKGSKTFVLGEPAKTTPTGS